MQVYKDKITSFLLDNGFQVDEAFFDDNYEFTHYVKNDFIGIDMSEKEIVLIDETGDYAECTINHSTIYWLIGHLVCFNKKIAFTKPLSLKTIFAKGV